MAENDKAPAWEKAKAWAQLEQEHNNEEIRRLEKLQEQHPNDPGYQLLINEENRTFQQKKVIRTG